MEKNYEKIDNWNQKIANDLGIILTKKDSQTVSMYNVRNEYGNLKTPKQQAYEIKIYQIKVLEYIRKTPAQALNANFEENFKTLCENCKKVFPWGESCHNDLMNFVWCEMVSECICEAVS